MNGRFLLVRIFSSVFLGKILLDTMQIFLRRQAIRTPQRHHACLKFEYRFA